MNAWERRRLAARSRLQHAGGTPALPGSEFIGLMPLLFEALILLTSAAAVLKEAPVTLDFQK
jgi:hypothetical protein